MKYSRQLTKREAIECKDLQTQLTKRELFLFQIHQNKLCMPFDVFHEATEIALGRPVWTHEFAKPKELLKEFLGQINRPTFKDIIEKFPKDKKVIVCKI